MYPELKKNIRTLLAETEVFHEDLEMTKRDSFNWVKKHKINELAKITEHLKKLESDLVIMQVDCITLTGQTYQSHGTWQIFNRSYLTFFILYSLLNELKKIGNRLGCFLICPDQTGQSDIDLDRSRETINQIQKYLLIGVDFHNADQCSPINRGLKRYLTIGSTL